MASFILPWLDFLLQGANVEKKSLKEADKEIKKMAKNWLSLPQRVSAEVAFLLPNRSGGSLLPLANMVDLLTVAHAFIILTCKEATVSELAILSLRKATFKRMKKAVSEIDQDSCRTA